MDGKRFIPTSFIALSTIIAVQIGGFTLLWSKDISPPEYVYFPPTADKTAANSNVNTHVVDVSASDEKALRQMIKGVLEQELRSYMNQMNSDPQKNQGPQSSVVAENSPENIHAYTEATTILKAAIASGQWTMETNTRMQAWSSKLTPEQHKSLLDEVGMAYKNGQITFEKNISPIF